MVISPFEEDLISSGVQVKVQRGAVGPVPVVHLYWPCGSCSMEPNWSFHPTEMDPKRRTALEEESLYTLDSITTSPHPSALELLQLVTIRLGVRPLATRM